MQTLFAPKFQPSLGDAEWLGDGVYFFVEGVSSPKNNAVKWAIASAWDKSKKCYKYDKYAVVKVEICVDVDKLLDLTEDEGVEIFNYFREKYTESIKKSGMRSKTDFKDGHIINRMRIKYGLDIDVVKSNFYIKFKTERILNINFRVPNATIIATFNVNTINNRYLIVNKGEVND